jgi:hypothetical protein
MIRILSSSSSSVGHLGDYVLQIRAAGMGRPCKYATLGQVVRWRSLSDVIRDAFAAQQNLLVYAAAVVLHHCKALLLMKLDAP